MSNRVLIVSVGILMCLHCAPLSLQGQDRERNGYLAATVGPSFLPGEYYNGVAGIQVTLVEFGYTFSHGIGVSASWVGGGFSFESTAMYSDGSAMQPIPAQFQVGYGMLVVGPMYSIKTGNKSSIDLKARAGRYLFEETIKATSLHSASSNTSVGYLISATYQKKLTNWWTFLASVDYGRGRKPVTIDSYEHINSIAVTAGIGVRL